MLVFSKTADFFPGGRYATLMYTGPYKGKGVYKANVVMVEWAKENKVKWSITKKKGIEWWDWTGGVLSIRPFF